MPNFFMRRLILGFKFFPYFVFIFPFFACAQSVEQLYKAANESLTKGEYYAAAKYFKQALDKEDSQPAIWYGFAESSRLFNDYKNAALGYEQTIKTDKENAFPLSNFWLGSMLINQREYENAKEHLIAFQNKYRKKDFYAQKVQQLIESCAWALANNTEKDIEIIHLPDSVNSTFSELNPFLSFDGKLCYSSTKPVKGKSFRTQMISAETGESFLPGVAETSAKHIANGFFSNNKNFGEEVFFTQCQTESGVTRCKIFVSKFEKNQWQAAKEIPVNINLSGYTATHPNVLNEPNGNQWLFFASNRPGTKGKMDIWFAKRVGALEWDYPQNAGAAINSIDDEITPFTDAANNQLYFSSQWHYGYGGFDVFSANILSLSNGEFGKPKNIGKPINSSANELYYAVYDSVAFFSSNRIGSKSIEAETCCNDIYEAINKSTAAAAENGLALKQDTVTATDKATQHENSMIDYAKQTPETNKSFAPSVTDEQSPPITSKPLVSTTLVLYFHNDEPNPKSVADTTTLSYVDAYESYINLENEYAANFSSKLNGTKKNEAITRIRAWFADTVEANFMQLVATLSQLENALNAGKKITLTVSGYCSPLNFNEYNLHLGNRRATSVFNFLLQYKNAVFQKFVAERKLRIERITNGEETAAKTVSDNLSDLRNSVYNPDAAKERRVELKVTVE